LADRPREQLLAEGPQSLRIADLLGILVRSASILTNPPFGGEEEPGYDTILSSVVEL
jgi:hypothetical protein